MSSTTSNTTTSPRFSACTAPPPYTSSDAYSIVSGKSTSKSLLNKVFNRKPSENPSKASDRATSNKECEEKEAIHAARAAYFSTL
ncbi:Nn.00g099150.m01.CDS01 [Neocucurbitaria sp. VM-36]